MSKNEKMPSLVLIADDEFLLRLAIAENLRDVGIEVLDVSNAADALATVRAAVTPIEAAVIDYNLPDMKGHVLAAELRKLDNKMMIVIASGYETRAIEKRFAPDERLVFLPKPYTVDDLLAALRRI